MNKYITTVMSVVLIAIGPLMFSACSTAGAYMKSKNGAVLALGPTSILGEQIVKESKVTTPEGAVIETKGYATHNPDRKLTEAAKVVATTDIITDGTVKMAGMTKDTTLGIDNNNTKVELAKEGTKLEGVKGDNAVKILNATPKQ